MVIHEEFKAWEVVGKTVEHRVDGDGGPRSHRIQLGCAIQRVV